MSICQALFGKRKKDLDAGELREFHRLAKKASHYKHHRSTTLSLRERAQAKKRAVLSALGWEARCVRCGYDTYIGALDFHHRDPSEKTSIVLTLGLARAIEEARKCDLICANCHREVHANETPRSVGRPREEDANFVRYLQAAGMDDDYITRVTATVAIQD